MIQNDLSKSDWQMLLKIQPQAFFKTAPQTLLKIKQQFLLKFDPQTLLKIATQLWLKKGSKKRYSKIYPQNFLKNDPQALLKIYPERLLKMTLNCSSILNHKCYSKGDPQTFIRKWSTNLTKNWITSLT